MTAGIDPSLALEPSAVRGKKHWEYADVLRVAATVAVVMIHVAGQGVVHTEEVNKLSWWGALCFDAMSRWAVPMFVMISGALLLEPTDQPMGAFFKRRVMRVAVPLVFWSCAYLVWRRYYVGETQLTPPECAKLFFLGTPAFHLYFLFLILGLYLFTPMFRAFVRRGNRAELITVTALALCMVTINHSLRIALRMWVQPTAFEMFVPYVGYFLAGYVLANTPGSTLGRLTSWAMLIGGIAGVIIGVGSTGRGIWSAKGPHAMADGVARMNVAMELYWDFTSPAVMSMTLAIFALTVDWYRRAGRGRKWLAKLCRWIAPASLGIYLIHPMGLWEIFKRHGMPVHPNTLIAAPAWTLALFLGCLLVTKILQKIPFLRYVVG